MVPAEATPIADRSKFKREIFFDWMSNHEIPENIVPRKIWSYMIYKFTRFANLHDFEIALRKLKIAKL